jgi:hypothetical protein
VIVGRLNVIVDTSEELGMATQTLGLNRDYVIVTRLHCRLSGKLMTQVETHGSVRRCFDSSATVFDALSFERGRWLLS